MSETTDSRETKNHTLSNAISNLDESIAKLRALRNEIGFNQPEPEKESKDEPEQGLDNLALLMEHGSRKINSQNTDISSLVKQIHELLF